MFNDFEQSAYKMIANSFQEIEYEISPEVEAICSVIRDDKHDQCLDALEDGRLYQVTATKYGFTATVWAYDIEDVRFTDKFGENLVLNSAEKTLVSGAWLTHQSGYQQFG